MIKRLLCLGLTLVPAIAVSLEWEAEASSGFEYTTNGLLDERATVSELQSDMSIATEVSHQGARSSVEADYNVSHNYYQRSFDADTTVQGSSDLSVAILPQSLIWTSRHVRSDTLRRFSDNDTPVNRVIRQDFQTGPMLLLRLSPLDMLQSSATRNWRTTESDPARDSESDTVSIVYNRSLNAETGVGFSVSRSDVSFEAVQGYEIQSETVVFNREIRNGQISLSVGNNRINQYLTSSESPLIELRASKLLFRSDVSMFYSRALTHTSVDFLELGADAPFFGLEGFTDVVERESFRLNLAQTFAETSSVNLGVYVDISASQVSNVTNERRGIIAQGLYSRPLSSYSSTHLSYSLDILNDRPGDSSVIQDLDAGYDRTLNRRLSITTGLSYTVRTGSSSRDYSRKGVFARITYQLYEPVIAPPAPQPEEY
ncbi:MAG: hypothetical protein KUG83_09935 [Gammaproteobacteria bacterium]|nr:hypothetical protein [Gammaproteobacteria bacterium]